MKKAVVASMLAASLALAPAAVALLAHSPAHAADKGQIGGSILGGIGGAIIGSKIGKGRGKTVGTIAGGVLGVLVGGEIGRQLDERDRLLMAQQTQQSLEKAPSGQSTEWRNPDTGASGTIIPKAAYTVSSGQVCREFQQTVTIGGKSEQAYGTACRQPDGSWKIVE